MKTKTKQNIQNNINSINKTKDYYYCYCYYSTWKKSSLFNY